MPNEVSGMETALPEEVADKMKALLTEYNRKEEKTFENILDFHVKFERIHPFCEGNTRAAAVFMIKYMKTFGFKVNNDAFEKNSWYFRNALVRANYNDLQNGIHATTKFLEMFFSNLILGTEYELKNRYMHVYYADDHSQSVNPKFPKAQFDTLECTLEELAVLEMIYKNPSIKQKELVTETGKSLSTIKRIMEFLQKKEYIRRVDGKRYGKWEVLVNQEKK